MAAGPEPSEAPKDCWSLLMGIAVEGFLGGLGFGVGFWGLGVRRGFECLGFWLKAFGGLGKFYYLRRC